MASVAKFRMNEAPRLLAHCSRTQKNSGSHIHKDRTELNFNMAYGQHTGLLFVRLLRLMQQTQR